MFKRYLVEMTTQTIAIDFDGVIHKYSKGLWDGTIYDEPMDGAFNAIREYLKKDYNVFILTARSTKEVKRWMDNQAKDIRAEIIPFWKKLWMKKGVLGITNKKFPAHIYIDDKGYKFKNWKELMPY